MTGLIIRGLGTRYPSVHNHTEDTFRITFTLVGSDEQKSVEVGPREVAPFLSRDGKLRADLIEVV